MKNKLFYMMLITGLGFAASTAWLISDIWLSFAIKKFDMDSLPVFVFATGLYGASHVMYYGKTRYVRRKIIPINKYYGITEHSQTPVKL